MLMLDVRNAIANILDRYTLADVVEVTLRKLRKDRMPLPFSLASLDQLRAKPALRSKPAERAKKSDGQAPIDKVAI
jgi:hypothetical protein